MGTFTGHALPGGFFILWSLFHTYHTCWLYFDAAFSSFGHQRICRRRSRRCGSGVDDDDDDDGLSSADADVEARHATTRRRFYSTNIYYCCNIRRIPIDSYLKLFAAVAGITGEVITAFDAEWHFAHYGNLQHIAMFGMFGLFAIVEALNFVGAPLPRGADYGVLILAYASEAILFAFHVHGRDALDVTLHTLLVYTVWACALGTLFEMCCRRHVMAPLSRTYFTLLQGLWFYVVGFILYNPLPHARPWSAENHDHMMLAVALYVWVGGAAVVLMLAVAMLAYLRVAAARRGKDYSMLKDTDAVGVAEGDPSTMIPMNGHMTRLSHAGELNGKVINGGKQNKSRHLTTERAHLSDADDDDDEVEHFRL